MSALEQELQKEIGEAVLLMHDMDHLFRGSISERVQAVRAVAVDKPVPRTAAAPLAHKVACGEQRDGGFLAGCETTATRRGPSGDRNGSAGSPCEKKGPLGLVGMMVRPGRRSPERLRYRTRAFQIKPLKASFRLRPLQKTSGGTRYQIAP